MDPDFSNSCTRCLREVYLKRDQDDLKESMMMDIKEMGVGFGMLLEEFGIKNNIKQDFCTFTGNMVKAVLEDLD